MGLASGKSKLKLIDIEPSQARDFARQRLASAFGQKAVIANTVSTVNDDRLEGNDAGTEIGAMLRAAREASGQDIREAARDLRIRHEYLSALENGDFEALPGMTYAIGYVRSYAQLLGLDVERSVALFKAEARDLSGPRQLVFPSPAPEGKVPGRALMFVAALLAVFAYAGWYHISDSGNAVAGYTLEVPQALQSWLDEKSGGGTSEGFTTAAIASSLDSRPEDAEASLNMVGDTVSRAVGETEADTVIAAVTPSVELPVELPQLEATSVRVSETPAASVQETETAESMPLVGHEADREPETPMQMAALPTEPVVDGEPAYSSDTANPIETEPVVETPTAAPTPLVSAPENAIPSAPLVSTESTPSVERAATTTSGTARSRVLIRANAASWVQVRAADSTTVMTKVMRAGDEYEVPERAGLKLFTGNAGALTILIDGKPVPRIGESGQVARNIDLTPEVLEKQIN
jgi:cytoskeleton protein RodZ